MQTIFWLYLVIGALLVVVSIPLTLGKVPPNWLYGFRARRTLEDPAVWYPANAYAGRWLLAAGIVTIAATVLFALVPGLSVDAYALLCCGVTLAMLAVTVYKSFRYLNSLNK